MDDTTTAPQAALSHVHCDAYVKNAMHLAHNAVDVYGMARRLKSPHVATVSNI
ncbi:MAG: hypothetical protein WBA73_08210 [Devosia sp.]